MEKLLEDVEIVAEKMGMSVKELLHEIQQELHMKKLREVLLK